MKITLSFDHPDDYKFLEHLNKCNRHDKGLLKVIHECCRELVNRPPDEAISASMRFSTEDEPAAYSPRNN